MRFFVCFGLCLFIISGCGPRYVTDISPPPQPQGRPADRVFAAPVQKSPPIQKQHDTKHYNEVFMKQVGEVPTWTQTKPKLKTLFKGKAHRSILCKKADGVFALFQTRNDAYIKGKTLADMNRRVHKKVDAQSEGWMTQKGALKPCPVYKNKQYKRHALVGTKLTTLKRSEFQKKSGEIDQKTTTMSLKLPFERNDLKPKIITTRPGFLLVGWYKSQTTYIHYMTRVDTKTGQVHDIDLTQGDRISLHFRKGTGKVATRPKIKAYHIKYRRLDKDRLLLQYIVAGPRGVSKTGHVAIVNTLDGRIIHLTDIPRLTDLSLNYDSIDGQVNYVFASSTITVKCKGVYTITDDNRFVCYTKKPVSKFIIFKKHRVLEQPFFWTEPLHDGWKLEHTMSEKQGMRSRLLSPEGMRYHISDNEQIQCQLSDFGAPKTLGKFYLKCAAVENGKLVTKYPVWDQETKSAQRAAYTMRSKTSMLPRFEGRSLFGRPLKFVHRYTQRHDYETYYIYPQHRLIPFDETGRSYAPLPKYALLFQEDQPTKLVLNDKDTKSYQVLKTYTKKDCAHELTPGTRGVTNARFVVVYCTKKPLKAKYSALLIWSEVLDLDTKKVWRTKNLVSKMNRSTLFVSNPRTPYESDFSTKSMLAVWP